jgi:hypothetical protein
MFIANVSRKDSAPLQGCHVRNRSPVAPLSEENHLIVPILNMSLLRSEDKISARKKQRSSPFVTQSHLSAGAAVDV